MGKKGRKKNSKQLWRWWCPSRGRDPCQCFPFGGSRKTGFQCVDFEIISELFSSIPIICHLKNELRRLRCPKLYQLLKGSKVLRVSPAWSGKKNTGSEGCVEARKDFVCWKYTSRKLIWQWKITIFNKRYIDSNSRCFSIVMFSGVYNYKRVPKMEKDVIVCLSCTLVLYQIASSVCVCM